MIDSNRSASERLRCASQGAVNIAAPSLRCCQGGSPPEDSVQNEAHDDGQKSICCEPPVGNRRPPREAERKGTICPGQTSTDAEDQSNENSACGPRLAQCRGGATQLDEQ